MSEASFVQTICVLTAGVVLLARAIGVPVTRCTRARDNAIRAMVEGGADPLQAACAVQYQIRPEDLARCMRR